MANPACMCPHWYHQQVREPEYFLNGQDALFIFVVIIRRLSRPAKLQLQLVENNHEVVAQRQSWISR